VAGKPALALTVVNGGINRLRVKGAADRNSLYDLVNGYVSYANTLKVRPGTLRIANLAAAATPGITKGLVYYGGEFHVFCHEEVTVPSGFQLHILTHPSAQQNSQATGQFTAQSASLTGKTLGSNSQAGSLTLGSCVTGLLDGSAHGAIAPASIDGQTIDGFLVTSATSTDDPNTVYLVMPSIFPITQGWLASYPSVGEGTVTTALDTGNLANAVLDMTEATYYVFKLGAGTAFLPNWQAGSLTITLTYPTVSPVPIKEIHYATPFLGYLYVVAEFDTTSTANTVGNVFHYWVQSASPTDPWEASTDYMIGDVVLPDTPNGLFYVASRLTSPNPVWTAGATHQLNDKVEPTVPNGFYFTATTVVGGNPVSGQTEPTWPTTDGGVVQEESTLTTDQSVTLVQSAPQTSPTATLVVKPIKYTGTIAGGFSG
jgi:hypothetical protein